jgi:chorismate synthase
VRFGFSTAGESHGPAEVALVHGVPAGLRLTAGDVNRDLSRRQKGYGRGGRQKIEKDEVEFLGGVRHGYTLGSPVAMLIRNRDYANWEDRMTPEPVEDPPQKITLPRPGHADLAGMQSTTSTTCETSSNAPAPARLRPAWQQAVWQRSSWPSSGSR